MNSLAFFNPRFTSDLFDVIDRNMGNLVPSQNATQIMTPRVDVRETPTAYILDMDLPGLSEKDIEINLKDRVLSISSKIEAKKEEKKDGEWLIKERKTSCFSRHFTLPQDIDTEKVSAEFKHGVLSVDIPRKPESKTKQIAITVH